MGTFKTETALPKALDFSKSGWQLYCAASVAPPTLWTLARLVHHWHHPAHCTGAGTAAHIVPGVAPAGGLLAAGHPLPLPLPLTHSCRPRPRL